MGVALIGVYALGGFYLAPYLVQTQLLPMLSERLGGHLAAAEVAINPFQLTLAVRGISLKDGEGRDLAAIGEFAAAVNGLDSIERRALVASARLFAPEVRIEIGKDGKPNFAFLLPPAGKKPENESISGFPFQLVQFRIERGRLAFQDHSRGAGFTAVWSSLDFSLENLSSLPGASARFSLAATGKSKDTIAAAGGLALAPLASEGEIKLTGIGLAPLAVYLPPPQPYKIRDGALSLNVKYKFGAGEKGAVFDIPSGEAELKHFKLGEGDRPEPFLEIASLAVKGFAFQRAKQHLILRALAAGDILVKASAPVADENRLREIKIPALSVGDIAVALEKKSLSIGLVAAKDGELAAWLAADGAFGLPGMPQSAPTPAESEPWSEGAPWQVKIGSVELANSSLEFKDYSVTPAAELRFAPATLRLTDFTTKPGAALKLSLDTGVGKKGHIGAEGQIGLKPVTAELSQSVSQVRLRPFQSYLDQAAQMNLVKGRLNLDGNLSYTREQNDALRFSGQADITNFAAEDKREGKDFVNWKDLQFNGLIFETAPRRLSIREVVASAPYARVLIDEDGKLNLSQNLASSEVAKNPPPRSGKEGEPLPVVIGSLRVINGQADFADLTLKPTKFAANIRDLNGAIRGLSSQKTAKADVLLEGKLNQSSSVKISGKINPFRMSAYTDIAMQFRDVNLTTLSPYSGKFAGYRIEKGKLSMDLKYRLADDQLVAENNIEFDQLILGERVESPNATSLPVRLAVALLKDSSGKIDLNLPISGDLSDPQISVRGLLASAVKQMVTKLVSSPFSLLGGIVQNGGEELGFVKFDAGMAWLTEEEKTKLAKLAVALKKRPDLSLEIKGMANQALDKTALAARELLRQLKNAKLIELRMAGEKKSDSDDLTLSEEDYRRLFTQFYRTKNPNSPEVLVLASGPGGLSGNQLADAERRVLAGWTIGELELRVLAQARGESIREYLVKEAGLPDQRIYLLDVKFSEPEEREIKSLLSLSGS